MGEIRKKTGGRKKGTPNKRTELLQELLDKNNLDPIEGIKEALEELNSITAYEPSDKISLAKEKANIYLELLQYIYPKRKSIDLGEATVSTLTEVYDLTHADEDNQSNLTEENQPTEKA